MELLVRERLVPYLKVFQNVKFYRTFVIKQTEIKLKAKIKIRIALYILKLRDFMASLFVNLKISYINI